MKKLRYRIATFATSKEGVESWGIGGRIGYWPCVGGPFIQLGFGKRRISIWYGTEYEDPSEKKAMQLQDWVSQRTIMWQSYPPSGPWAGVLWVDDSGSWWEWNGFTWVNVTSEVEVRDALG